MENLKTGQFFGQTNQTIQLEGITLTDTEYTHEKVDWHYHENAYFTFILQGRVLEGNKKETYNCSAGSLLFHNWQESHYNIKPKGFTRGFHIELEHNWFKKLDIDLSALQGSISLQHPDLKSLMYRIFKETKLNHSSSSLSVQVLLIELLSRMAVVHSSTSEKTPLWVAALKEILHNTAAVELTTVGELAQILGIHPVHLSRDFRKYFGCSPGEYIRKVKVQQSLSLLPSKALSLTEIALTSGFADQSHFIRCFKTENGITPSQYRKLLIV
ncbi:AraC family transcriptional regulator [Cesiribacter sp. SM1]|uniref:helix-turn-helix domain-containing protein n=1 Tax=Cesiribacter sp. SM1 TaxID=2861196 RepID=UPI001CD27197|nr:helix-turn-helix transcriptional regulator [Cesiribacter sp. SM1]